MADHSITKSLAALDHISRDRSLISDWPDAIDSLAPLAHKTGLSTKQINQGWDIALSGRLSTPHATALLPLLLPRHPLTPHPILRLVSTLGEQHHSKPRLAGQVDYRLQRAALERLSLLLDAGAVSREAREAVGALWGVLARGLEYGTLRDATATVLSQITRRKHVLDHRICHLRALIDSLDAPPASCHRLLSVFYSYCPELVPNYAPTKTGGKELRGKKQEFVNTVRALLRDPNEQDTDGREAKRRRIGEAHIPSAATHSASTSSTPLSDITSLAELALRMPTMELPSQAGSVLGFVSGATSEALPSEGDRARAWAVVTACGFGGDPRYIRRIDSFIDTQLRHELCELDETPAGQARVEDLLARLRELSRLGGEVPPSVERFLASFLITWDGETHQEVIFDLVALCKPTEYSAFYDAILSPLQKLAVSASPTWLAALIDCLTALIRTLALRPDWAPADDSPPDPPTAFARLASGVNHLDSLEELLRFADRAVRAASGAYPDSVVVRHAGLGLYEAGLGVAVGEGVGEGEGVPVVVLPGGEFVYGCLVAGEVAGVARICGVVAKIREALTSERTAVERESPENARRVQQLNAFLVDFVSLLWQKKLLDQDDDGGTAKPQVGLTSEQVEAVRASMQRREQVLGPALGLTVHPALAPLAKRCLDALEEEAGVDPARRNRGPPVLASTLKELATEGGLRISFTEFRARFLDWLQEAGAGGIGEFLGSSLQSLIRRKAGGGAAGMMESSQAE